jgi:hypothetical protein
MKTRTRQGKEQGECPRCSKWRALTREWWYANRTTGDYMPPCKPMPVGDGRGVARAEADCRQTSGRLPYRISGNP